MKLAPDIAELLYRYDCVIVPDFGGFIANYNPARINSKTDTFSPPSKQISFNGNLTLNDGLLANHIARKYNLNYEQAMEAVGRCVASYKSDLKEGKKVVIENIGVLIAGQQGRIIFEPLNTVNFLSDAFGLEKFHFPAPSNEIPVINAAKSGRKFYYGKIAAAVAIPLLLAGTWLAYRAGVEGKYGDLQFSNLGFSTVPAVYEVRKPVNLPKANSKSIDALILSIEKKADELPLKKTAPPAPVSNKNWYVIGGCFSSPANARKFRKKLEKKGYQPVIIDNYKSMTAVAYGAFADEQKARSFLRDIKAGESKSAWLLRN